MPDATTTLPLSAAALAALATGATAFGLRRPYAPGWGWWMSALWLAALGAWAGAALPGPAGPALAAALLMQWPVLALLGLRRFQPRQALPGGAKGDLAVLGAAATLAAASIVTAPAASGAVVAACSLVVHLYAALRLFQAPVEREATPVLALAAAMALAAFLPGVAALTSGDWLPPLPARAAAALLGSLVLALVAITLVCERTEHQLRDSRRRLRTLANLDGLTQVPNRRHFHDLAAQALRQDAPGSAVLVLFDVDHFKQINDLLGHAAGDRALCLVSASVLQHLRADDVPGRHGGDEFVLLLRHTNPTDAVGVAARIVAEVQRRAPGEALPALTLSFGLVQLGPREAVASALRRADQALYEAKRQGRARAVAALGDESQPVFSVSERMGLAPG